MLLLGKIYNLNTPLSNMALKLTKQEQEVLLMCDDAEGLTCLIARKLECNDNQANEFMGKFVELDLVTKDPSHQTKSGRVIRKNEKGDQYWYELTSFGKECLHSIDR